MSAWARSEIRVHAAEGDELLLPRRRCGVIPKPLLLEVLQNG